VLFRRQDYPGLFRIPPEQHRCVTNALHQFRSRLTNNLLDYLISRITITHADFELDKLMYVQGDIHFWHNTVFQAMLAYHDDRFERMSKAAKMTDLIIGKGQWGSPGCYKERHSIAWLTDGEAFSVIAAKFCIIISLVSGKVGVWQNPKAAINGCSAM